MKIELHSHTNRYSICANNSPQEILQRMIRTGYEAVYLTEHDNLWTESELAELQESFPEIAVFGGVEKTLDQHHLLILGADDVEYLAMEEPADLLEKARDDGHLTVLAHPFRWSGGAAMLHEGLLPDALEGRTPNHGSRGGDLSLTMASSLSLAVVNSGDVHALDMINQYWIETDHAITRADEIRETVRSGHYKNVRNA